MKIYESAENYLEIILVLQDRLCAVRSIDIVNELGFSKPSVSIAMKRLRENGYIDMQSDGHITLTQSGLQIANKVYSRHRLLMQLFTHLGVNEDTANADACKIEHDLSEETYEKIKDFMNSKQK